MVDLYDEILLDLYNGRENESTFKKLEEYLLSLSIKGVSTDGSLSHVNLYGLNTENIWVLICLTSYLGYHTEYRLKMQSLLIKWNPDFLNVIVNSGGLNNYLFEVDINNIDEDHMIRKYHVADNLSKYIMKEDVSYANVIYRYGTDKVIGLLLNDLSDCVGRVVVLNLCLNILFSEKSKIFDNDNKNKVVEIIGLHSYEDIEHFIKMISQNHQDKLIHKKIAYLEELVLSK